MTNSLNDGLNKPDQVVQGAGVQVGSLNASAATTVVTFSPSFAGAPVVITTLAESGATTSTAAVHSVGTGSFSMLTTSGLEYNWNASYFN